MILQELHCVILIHKIAMNKLCGKDFCKLKLMETIGSSQQAQEARTQEMIQIL